MQLLSDQVNGYLDRASWIRKMFEQGAKLMAEFGRENVYDFSLGNPDLPPPHAVAQGLNKLAENAETPFAVGYMPNAGYPEVRQAVAAKVTAEQGVEASADDLVITCGAAGGLNALFRAILAPGEEVISPAPFFVEYGFYTENHGGVFKTVPSHPEDFSLDIPGFEAAISEKTRVVLINSPNNPTGAIYSKEQIDALAALLDEKSRQYGRPIFLVSDEPYRFLAFDGAHVPSILPAYEHSVVVSSFSKNLSLAGERIGYVVVNPAMGNKAELMAGLILTNRILGYVNAPALGQKLLLTALDSQVDAAIYDSRRGAMAKVLDDAGYDYFMPAGAFYFFPKAPGGDDVAFCAELTKQRVLAVPGRGFGFPGYFRLAFCVNENVINGAAEGFKKAIEGFK